MSDAPRVATVVLNFRETEDTLRAVAAVRASAGADPRVIVVNNSAPDSTHADLVYRLGADVECLASGGNLGYAGGNNVGIRHALTDRPDFIWLLNPDTEVEPDCLSRLLATGAERPNTGAIGPRLVFPNRRKIQFDGGLVDDATFGTPSHLHYGRQVADTPAIGPREVDYVNGASILIRRTALEQVGLLPEEYFLYFEETAFCRDLGAAGWRCLVDPRAVTVHHVRSRPGLPTPYYLYYMTRNRLYFARRYFDAAPEDVLANWHDTFLDSWRRRAEREAPDWVVTFDAIIERAVADARAGIVGYVPEVDQFPAAPPTPPKARKPRGTAPQPVPVTTSPAGRSGRLLRAVRDHWVRR
ncbi:MAG: glycosyltransferase family 2 protein [Sporichthyaceae bacterium]